MDLGIVVPLIALPIVIVGVFLWYRRSIADLRPGDARPVSGVRLTAESLHRSPSPPWRVVYEIGGALGGIDHVVIGPPGVIAITTVAADRPPASRLVEATGSAQLVSEAAVARGPVEELARPVGIRCELSARVFWGVPDAGRPAHDDIAHGAQTVEGQRLQEWLDELVAESEQPLDQGRIDLAWQAIVLGIGRPDPLA